MTSLNGFVVLYLMGCFVLSGQAQSPTCQRTSQADLEPGQLSAGEFSKRPDAPTHPCTRNCTGSATMMCEYTLVVEWYYTMSKACYECPCNQTDCYRAHCVAADGIRRQIIVANRMLPGPPMEVCEGDQVIVDVVNRMNNGESVTLHWHGLYQRDNQYMDGVFMVTQCPIPPHNSFRYNFTADHPGTHWWHAHTGIHRADGLFGALVIRQADEANPHSALYDFDLPEHKVIVNDWMREGTENVYLSHVHVGTDDDPASILINGKGKYGAYNASTVSGSELNVTPRELYEVEQGKRYRFRVVSSGITNAPMLVSVDDHNITLISSDGSDVEPLEVDAFYMYGGERYDFVLNASQPVGNYWLKVQGFKQGGAAQQGLAIIRYNGAPSSNPTEDPSVERQGVIYQDMHASYDTPDEITTVDELKALVNESIPQEGKRTVYLSYNLNSINNPMFNDPVLYPFGQGGPGYAEFALPQINRRTFKFTDYPLLTQFDDDLNADDLCEVDDVDWERCKTEFCTCTQVIQVDLGQTLEIVLIDESKSQFEVEHPFHLHGHAFRILAQGKIGGETTQEEVEEFDKAGGIVRNFDRPPQKDSVNVPSGGYTVIQFVADNPGWWFLHCHMEFHLEDGMGVLIRVGNQSDLPPKPENFPQCGDYIPLPSSLDSPNEGPSENSTTPSSLIVIIILAVAVGLLVLVVVILLIVIISNRDRMAGGGDGMGRAKKEHALDPSETTRL